MLVYRKYFFRVKVKMPPKMIHWYMYMYPEGKISDKPNSHFHRRITKVER